MVNQMQTWKEVLTGARLDRISLEVAADKYSFSLSKAVANLNPAHVFKDSDDFWIQWLTRTYAVLQCVRLVLFEMFLHFIQNQLPICGRRCTKGRDWKIV